MQPLGIIYACNPRHCFSRQVEELSEKIPVVVISNHDDAFSIDAVALNNQKPGILMARHLLELGHRDVAFIRATAYGETAPAAETCGRFPDGI